MTPYEKFKLSHKVASLSKEDLFNLAYAQGRDASEDLAQVDTLLRQVADCVSKVYRCGGNLSTDEAKNILRQIHSYNPSAITCAYSRKYINMSR